MTALLCIIGTTATMAFALLVALAWPSVKVMREADLGGWENE